jgi:hypothetical protein
MNQRFLHIDADGETILSTLTMSAEEAALAVATGQSLLAIDPETDGGGVINDAVFKVNLTGGAGGEPSLEPIDPEYAGPVPGNIQLSQLAP